MSADSPPGAPDGGEDGSDADAGRSDGDRRSDASDDAPGEAGDGGAGDPEADRPPDRETDPADGGPDLERLREEVEAIDRDLVGLIARRTYLAEAIAAEKERRDLPTVDERRERRVLDRAAATADLFDLDPDRVRTVFRELIELNKHEQERRRSTGDRSPDDPDDPDATDGTAADAGPADREENGG